MASPETAGALLTAQSLIIAALAIVLQRHELLTENVDLKYKIFSGISVTILIAVSFLGSIAYLHIAEYPRGIVGSRFPPEMIFNVTTATFVGFVYVGLVSVSYLYSNGLRSDFQENEE